MVFFITLFYPEYSCQTEAHCSTVNCVLSNYSINCDIVLTAKYNLPSFHLANDTIGLSVRR